MSDSEPIPRTPAVFGAMRFAASPGVEHVAIAGDLSAATVGTLESAFAAVGPDTLVVVLDLSAVTSLDDDARRTILAARRRLFAERRRMLVMASESVRRALAATTSPAERATRETPRRRVASALSRARGRRLALAPRAHITRRAGCG